LTPSIAYISKRALEGMIEIDTYLTGRDSDFPAIRELNDIFSDHNFLELSRPRFPYAIINGLVRRHYSESTRDKEMETIVTELASVPNDDNERMRKLNYYLTDLSKVLHRRDQGWDAI